MKRKLMIGAGTLICICSIALFAFTGGESKPTPSECPYWGTPDCPLIKNCPDAGTADCKYSDAIPSCCAKQR